MAGVFQASGQSGLTEDIVIRNLSGQVMRTDTLAFEAYNASNYANYVTAFTEQGSGGHYVATFMNSACPRISFN